MTIPKRLLCTAVLLASSMWPLPTMASGATSTPQSSPAPVRASAPRPAAARSFEIRGGQFLLDGKPFVIISGEMHYARIPHEYWRHRLKMARAMGLNTIATYVFWNVHEPEKGRWNFKGDADLVEFIREAQQEGLFVLLRPGPYVCAEWEFGGYPYWLLNEKTNGREIQIRSTDPTYLRYADRYLNEVGKRCAPLQAGRGGNILMVQVENEYGSFGSDKAYMAHARDAVKAAGFTVPLFTADGASQMAAGHIEGALPGLNGGSNNEIVRVVDRFQPGGPYIAPEVYPGWLDHWGEPFFHSNPDSGARALGSFVRSGHSISLYMFHGGTNFGFMNGANFGGNYEPHTTTYDYSAPLDEAGRPTSQYLKIREVLKAAQPVAEIPDVPAPNPITAVPRFTLYPAGSILNSLPEPVRSERVLPMEAIGQAYGFVLYRTRLKGPIHDRLTLRNVRDYAVVMLNGKTVGTLDRRRKQQTMDIDVAAPSAELDILVENCGRINYGPQLRDNHKGITEAVLLGDAELTGWEIYPLPMVSPKPAIDRNSASVSCPMFYSGSFRLEAVGDTFLDMRGWSKGAVWVNGHALGRYWSIGPQQTLYLPGPWLRRGANSIVVFESGAVTKPTVEGITVPVLDQLVHEPPLVRHGGRRAFATPPAPSASDLASSGEFTNENSAQTVQFAPRAARYVCLQSTSAFDGSDWASCAEFYVLDASGRPVKRTLWKVIYADSEEQASEDGSADNMIDGDASTIWHSIWSQSHTGHPHKVVIDLGSSTTITGFRYIPREGKKPGKIKGYRFYTSINGFPPQ